VLSVTNSAAFGVRQPIDSVRRAVIHLGPTRARAIALAFGLRLLADSAGLPTAMTHCLWVASLRKAAAARLAAHVFAPEDAEHAYCLALIQDIGLPLLAAVDPVFYQHELLPGARGDWSRLERARFGIDHAEVGQRLLRSWHGGEDLHLAIAQHHQPPDDFEGHDALVKLPAFIASLLPHLDEEMTGTGREWLDTLHSQFLSAAYPSPEAFFQATIDEANLVAPGQHEPAPQRSALQGELLRCVTSDTITLTTQLCRLETALGRQREDLGTLRFQAFTDSLTKVLNRRGFTQLAERRLEEAAGRGLGVCCLLIDLDDFKPVNDTYGHDAGDLILRGLAKLMRKNLDRRDLIGRIGGDEFAALVIGVDVKRARAITHRLCKAQHTRVRVADGVEAPLKFSIGAVHVERMDQSVTIEDMITAADEAMYQRKHDTKGGLCFVPFQPSPETPPRPGGE